ncbi:MAG: PAS domain-containing protein, partial [Lysobacteraceae bacterium]
MACVLSRAEPPLQILSRTLLLSSLFAPLISRLRAPSQPMMLDHHLSAIVHCAQEGVLVADMRAADAPIVYANQTFETITGYSRDEATGKNCRYLQGSDHLQPEIEIVRRALRAGTAAHVQLRNYRKDGSLFWNDLHLVPLGEGGAPTHYV